MERKNIILIVIVLLVMFGLIYYFVKKGTSNKLINTNSSTNIGNISTSTAVINTTVSSMSQSKHVNISDISTSPDVNNFSVANSSNPSALVLNSQPNIIQYIYFINNFTGNPYTCPNNVWYNGVYYVKFNSVTDASGNTRCFYKYDKNILPNKIFVFNGTSSLPPACSSYTVYLGGSKYVFDSITKKSNGLSYDYYCTYNKQN